MIIRLKHFHDTINIVVILDPGHEFLIAKCAQFPLTFMEIKLNDGHFFTGTVIIYF